MARGVRVQVLRRNIASQFQRGGQGYRWLDRVRESMHRRCVALAPVGGPRPPGVAPQAQKIKTSHRSSIRGLNGYAARAEVWNTADHAGYVHDGVPGTIHARGGGHMTVPTAMGSMRTRPMRAVSGQRPNPWLDRGCAQIAMSRGAVKTG